MAQTYTLTVDERSVEVEVWEDAGAIFVRSGGVVREVSLGTIDDGRLFSLLLDGASYEVYARRTGSVYDVLVGSEVYRIEVARGHRRAQSSGPPPSPGIRLLRSPMTGIVAELSTAAGQFVERGTVLLVLESMKMNNELRAEQEGIVQRIDVHPGQRVERGDPLLQLKVGD